MLIGGKGCIVWYTRRKPVLAAEGLEPPPFSPRLEADLRCPLSPQRLPALHSLCLASVWMRVHSAPVGQREESCEENPEKRAPGESLLGVLSEAPSREKTAACRAPSCVAGWLFLVPPSPPERSGAPVAGFSRPGAKLWGAGATTTVFASPSSRRHRGG